MELTGTKDRAKGNRRVFKSKVTAPRYQRCAGGRILLSKARPRTTNHDRVGRSPETGSAIELAPTAPSRAQGIGGSISFLIHHSFPKVTL